MLFQFAELVRFSDLVYDCRKEHHLFMAIKKTALDAFLLISLRTNPHDPCRPLEPVWSLLEFGILLHIILFRLI